MIESASYRICIWDNLPIEESPIFKTLLQENGVKFANRHTKRIHVMLKHPPPRGNENDRPTDLALGREGQYQLSSRGGVPRQAEHPYTLQTPEAG